MRKIFCNALVGLVCVASAGCASILTRAYPSSPQHPEPQYFGGVRCDYDVMTYSSRSDISGSILAPVCGVIDMPLSFCADILCLPYDLHTDHAYQKWKAGMTNTPPSASLDPATNRAGSSTNAVSDSARRVSAVAR